MLYSSLHHCRIRKARRALKGHLKALHFPSFLGFPLLFSSQIPSMEIVRRPSHAGSWYTDNRKLLSLSLYISFSVGFPIHLYGRRENWAIIPKSPLYLVSPGNEKVRNTIYFCCAEQRKTKFGNNFMHFSWWKRKGLKFRCFFLKLIDGIFERNWVEGLTFK